MFGMGPQVDMQVLVGSGSDSDDAMKSWYRLIEDDRLPGGIVDDAAAFFNE